MQFYCISACYVTPGPRLEVRCRNTMSKHVTANAVEVDAKTLRRNPRRNSERRAGCPPQRRSEWWRPVRGGRTGRMQPGRQGGGQKPGLHLCLSLLVFIFLARLDHSSKINCSASATRKSSELRLSFGVASD